MFFWPLLYFFSKWCEHSLIKNGILQIKDEGKPIQSRFLRSQQDLKAKLEEQVAAAGGDADVDG